MSEQELDCCIVTFNCGRELLNADLFADRLHAALVAYAPVPPDLLVFALEEVAPIAYSFVGGSYLLPYLQRFKQATNILVQPWATHNGLAYTKVASANAGMTALLVFAKSSIAGNIKRIDFASVRVGDYELGNKGAVAARLHYHSGTATDAQFTFVSAHLAPHEVNCERRNKDWQEIAENMLFEKSITPHATPADRHSTEGGSEAEPLLADSTTLEAIHGLYSPDSHVFVAGDLNYRTSDKPPSEQDAKTWPAPDSNSDRPSDAFKSLWANDQLSRERINGRTLQNFEEADIHFAPTYKYSGAAQRQAATENGIQGKVWAQHRMPSWCDRVLYRLVGVTPRIVAYDSLPLLPSSDHRPVFLRIRVPLKRTDSAVDAVKPAPFSISADAHARASRSRSKELAVGIAMLLALTWEGRLMLLGTIASAVGGWALIRSLL